MKNETKAAKFANVPDAAPDRGERMSSIARADTTIGDLVAAAWDEAAHYSGDPRKKSVMVSQAVMRLLRKARSRSQVTDAIQGASATGWRSTAPAAPMPVDVQVRVAVYTASVAASRRREMRALGSCP